MKTADSIVLERIGQGARRDRAVVRSRDGSAARRYGCPGLVYQWVGYCVLLASWSLLAAPAGAQIYIGEAVFDERITGYTIYPSQAAGEPGRIDCSMQVSIALDDMTVSLAPPSMSFLLRIERTLPAASPEACGTGGRRSLPVRLNNVTVSDAGVVAADDAGELSLLLNFNGDRTRLVGTVSYLDPVTSVNHAGDASLYRERPDSLLSSLVNTVRRVNAQAGIDDATDEKLRDVVDALDRAQAGDVASAVGLLYGFTQSVELQRGRALTSAEADELVAAARPIIEALSQP